MRAAKLDEGIKYFKLYAAVVIKTANVVVQLCRFAGDGTELFLSACCTRSARICMHSTNQIFNLWHFRFRSVMDSKVRYSF